MFHFKVPKTVGPLPKSHMAIKCLQIQWIPIALPFLSIDVLCNHRIITKLYQEIKINIILLLNRDTCSDFTFGVFSNSKSSPGSHPAFTRHIP